MKIPLLLLALATATFITSCSTKSYPGTGSYPNYPGGRDEQVIVTRDGRVIDRYGRVIGTTQHRPPGHAKKLYGSRSARSFAPGQRKKQSRHDNHRNERHDNRKGRARGIN